MLAYTVADSAECWINGYSENPDAVWPYPSKFFVSDGRTLRVDVPLALWDLFPRKPPGRLVGDCSDCTFSWNALSASLGACHSATLSIFVGASASASAIV